MAFKLSNHGKKLIKQYEVMAKEGFQRTDGSKVPSAAVYNSFQLKKFRYVSKEYFIHNKIEVNEDCGDILFQKGICHLQNVLTYIKHCG